MIPVVPVAVAGVGWAAVSGFYAKTPSGQDAKEGKEKGMTDLVLNPDSVFAFFFLASWRLRVLA